MDDELTNEWGEPYEYPPCDYCCSETRPDGGCPVCNPMELIASFSITDGIVEEVAL